MFPSVASYMRVTGRAWRRKAAFLFLICVPALLPSFQTGTLAEVVRDVTGSPLSGVKARLLSLDRVYEVKSRSNGAILFSNIVPGVYDLELSAAGLRSQIMPGVRIPEGDAQLAEISLAPTSQPDHCGFVRTVNYEAQRSNSVVLSGNVVDEDSGKGLGRVRVEVLEVASGTAFAATDSGPDGNFVFSDLPPGHYKVRASRKTYEPIEIAAFIVPRENLTVLRFAIDKQSHMHICQ
jgi:hypothetical protein